MQKWLILTSYCAASFLNGACWVVLVSVPEKAMDYYKINEEKLALYGVIASVVSIPLAPISGWLISKSFYYSLHIVWLTSLIGCWIRFLAGTNFWISVIGQSTLFLGNMLILSSCSTLAMLWFPKSQILLATTIASFSNFLGIGFGFVCMPYQSDISNMILIQAIFATIFFGFNLAVLKKCEKKEVVLSFTDSFLVASKNKTLALMILCSGSALAVNYGVVGILGLLLSDEGYSEIEIGWNGFAYLFSSLFGGLFATYILEYSHSILFTLKIFLIGSIITCFLFSGFIGFASFSFMTAALFGGFLTGSLPLCIRACINFIPEIDETMSTNMIFLISQILAIAYTYPILYFKEYTGITGIWVGGVIIMISYLMLLFIVTNIKENTDGKKLLNQVFGSSDDIVSQGYNWN